MPRLGARAPAAETDRKREAGGRPIPPRAATPRSRSACACGGSCPACLGTAAANGEAALAAEPGAVLDPTARRWMEQRFGHGFAGVRVHTDGVAQAATQALQTRAFAVGRHIAFAPGQYQPGTRDGRRLLAHELAHTLQQGRGGPVQGGAEAAADGAARAALAGQPVPMQPGHALGVQRDGPALPNLWLPLPRPVYSQPPEGDYSIGTPQRVSDDEVILPISTGRRFRVTRRRWTTTEDAGRTGRDPFVSADPGADYRQLWLTVEWCEGASEGTIRLSADAPEQALRAVANAVLSGGDIDTALAGMAFTPRLEANFQVGTVRFRIGADATIGVDGSLRGAGGSIRVEGNVPGGRLGGSIGGRSERPDGSSALGPPTIDFGLEFTPGEPATAPSCRVRHRTRVVRHQRFDCTELIDVPERSREVTEHVPETERRTRHLYFPYWSSTIDARRSAAQQALIRSDMDAGFAVASVEGYASPEGSTPASAGFEGNTALSQARSDAARTWLARACGERGEAYLPAAVAALGRGERHTLHEPGPDGLPREVEGDAQSDHAAAAFATDPTEADQRDPGTDAALARARTPAARAAVVYPQLRRVDVVLTRTRTVERTRTEVTPAGTREQEVFGGCPERLRDAAFPPARTVR